MYAFLRESCHHSAVVFMLLFLWRHFTGHTLWKLLSPYVAVSWWLTWWLEHKSTVTSVSPPRNTLYEVKFAASSGALTLPFVLHLILHWCNLHRHQFFPLGIWVLYQYRCLSSADFISRSYLLPPASLLRCPWLALQQLLVYPPQSSLLLLCSSGHVNVTWHCIKSCLLKWKFGW